MVVLLDTTSVAPRERNEAMMAIMETAAVPFEVTHDLPDEMIHNRTFMWNIGTANSIVRTQDTNMLFQRTAQKVRADDRELFAMSYQHSGTGVHVQGRNTFVQKPGALFVEHLAQVHSFEYTGTGDNGSFLMSYDDLGLPVDAVVEAATRLASSPIYRILQVHLARLSEVAELLPTDGEASALLALSTIQLIRALVSSTTHDRVAREAARDAQYDVVLAFVRQHLKNPELNARMIATGTHSSVRQVYKVWSGNGESLTDWILRERLAGARDDLSAPESAHARIETIARRWGFVDHSHFSRRFKQAFGSTPREWRNGEGRASWRS